MPVSGYFPKRCNSLEEYKIEIRENSKSYRERTRPQQKCRRIKYYHENKDRITKYNKAYRLANPIVAVRSRCKNIYKIIGIITPEPSFCEICLEPPKKNKHLCVDHCHISRKQRGWLCKGCNTSLGCFGDNIEGLEKAIAYLRRFEESIK